MVRRGGPQTDVAAIDLSRLVTKVVMQPTRESNGASSSSSLLGLAPGGVYTAIAVAHDAGGLLHHLFTLTQSSLSLDWAVILCRTFRRIAPPSR